MARRAPLPSLKHRVKLGPYEVSPVCLGMAFDPSAVAAAYEAGINFFFVTADMHWPIYAHLRQGLAQLFRKKGVRERVVVCAAAYVTQPDFCHAPFEEVVEAVPGLGRLDVLAAGGSYWNDFWPRLPVYLGHRANAHCGAKAIGASFHDRSLAREAIGKGLVDVGFVRFNPAHPGAATDLLPHLPKKRAPVFTFKSVYGWRRPEEIDQLNVPANYWRPHPTDHYRFALSAKGVDGVLCSLGDAREVRELSDALAAGALTEQEQTYLVELAALA